MPLLHPDEYKTMTHDEIMKSQPGRSLDNLVAAACGIESETNTNPSGMHEWEEVGGSIYNGTYRCAKCLEHDTNGAYGDEPLPKDGCKPAPILFRPSTDWNDAMLAAEKSRIFRSYDLSQDKYGKWWIHPIDDHGDPLVMMASTGPLAICRAILVHAKHKESES